MIGNLFSVRRINLALLGLILSFLCVLPALAQPTTLRESLGREQLTQNRLKEIDVVSTQIKNDAANVALYKKRRDLYGELLDLNFDNKDWFIYADRFEKELSRLVELEGTAKNYYQRGGWYSSRLSYSTPLYPYPPPNKISELYPHNIYVDRATADLLKALQLTSNPQERQLYYTKLSDTYSIRSQKLISAPDFAKWKDRIPLKLVKEDFETSIKYSRLALEAGASLPFIKTLKENLAATYLSNAEVAAKLGDSATALKFTQAAQKSRE